MDLTVPLPCVAPNPLPATVMEAPIGPVFGERLVIFGAGTTVKFVPALATPETVTTTFPVIAPDGTGTIIFAFAQLVGVPVTPLKVIVLSSCVAPKFVPVTVTDAPIAPDVGDKLVIFGTGSTVKLTPLLSTPLAFTTTFPEVAPVGTGTTMLVSLQLVGVPALVPNLTVLLPWVDPKPLPVIVTELPTGAAAGERLAMFGAGTTVKFTPTLATPETVTTTFPVVAPDGTGTIIFALAQLVGVPGVPLNVTVLVPCVAPKFVPVTVIAAPTAPDVGDKLVIFGTGSTVKLTPLLSTPLANTTTFPVVAAGGTGTTMLVSLQLAGVPALPLTSTVLLPCVAPKLVPVMVTEVATGPEVGDRLAMVGGGTTVKLTAALATPDTVTTTPPVVAPVGTGTTIFAAAQLVGVPSVPLKVTVLVPWVAPKFVPVTVTEAPTAPDVGDRAVMLGVGKTVKLAPLLSTPLANTTTFPVVAPVGTGTTMLVSLQLAGVPALPLNSTVPLPCVAPKPVPVMLIEAPTGPELGDRLAMLGGGTTVKLTPALATLDTVTTTFPVVAPEGTGTTIFDPAQLVGVPGVPLNVTVLVPCVEPKFFPVMVTDAPTAPDVGDKVVMLGAAARDWDAKVKRSRGKEIAARVHPSRRICPPRAPRSDRRGRYDHHRKQCVSLYLSVTGVVKNRARLYLTRD